MKKFLIRLKTIFLLLMAFSSCLIAVTVSAAETTTSETSSSELIYDFDAMPLNYKSILYDDDGIKYNNYVIIKSQSVYRFGFFNSDDIDYLELSGRYLNFRKSDNAVVKAPIAVFYYNFDGSFSSFKSTTTSSAYVDFFGTNYVYNYDSSSDFLQNWVDNVVYSSINVKYNDMTVYYAKNNKAVTIKDLVNLPAGTGGGEIVGPQPIPSQPGDYDFIGPLPLIPIEGDPTFQGFKDWLIKNKKYEDLASYGINCTENNISSVVDLWTGNYNSISGFFSSLKSAWSTINAVSQAKNIYNWLEQQWQLYKKSLITYETIPIESQVIDSSTDYDENGNFISSETAYLKLILNVLNTFRNDVNNISSIINDNIIIISNNIYRIASQLSSIPQYIADSTYNNFVEPLNLILDAITNSDNSGSDDGIFDDFYNKLLAVFIPDDAYMTSWTNDVTSLINSKFGFLSQFAELKQTIDDYCFPSETLLSASVDDGQLELEEYMNYPDFSLTAFETEHIKLSSKVRIIDWSTFDKYRLLFHRVVVAICYVIFITRRFKRSPNVVANNDIAN